MRPEDLFMPACALVFALTAPSVLAYLAGEMLAVPSSRGRNDRGSRHATILGGIGIAGLVTTAGARWVGPRIVDAPGSGAAMVFGALAGVLALTMTYRGVTRLPEARTAGVGIFAGIGVLAMIVVGATTLYRASDITAAQAAELPDGFDAPEPHTRIEHRARMDPWDPDIHLARAWASQRADHHARAAEDLERAVALGADPVQVAHLRADVLAGLDHCDEARVAYDRWLQLRAADAALRVLDDPITLDEATPPSVYERKCGLGWMAE